MGGWRVPKAGDLPLHAMTTLQEQRLRLAHQQAALARRATHTGLETFIFELIMRPIFLLFSLN